jgi:DNA-3-methyladenine glycosylase II
MSQVSKEAHPMPDSTDNPPLLPWSEAAYEHLLKADPAMAGLAKTHGPIGREVKRDYFGRLIRAIVGQQISGPAAAAIYRRLAERAGEPIQPEAFHALADEELRAAGLSRNKLLSVRDLTEHALDGRLDLVHLETLPDDEVRSQLVAVRGIGRWTADMFLMFSLGRPDVFPYDDLGILEGMKRLHDLESRPTPKVALKMANEAGWEPYRTAASFYLWQSLETP